MTLKTLYETDHPRIMITYDDENGEIILSRADRYMRNPHSQTPAFIPQHLVIMNINEDR